LADQSINGTPERYITTAAEIEFCCKPAVEKDAAVMV
jgi:hypothetical protein